MYKIYLLNPYMVICSIIISGVLLILLFILSIFYKLNTYKDIYGGMEFTQKIYKYHKFNDTNRKYSKFIELHLKNQDDFIEDLESKIVDWSDKNSISRVKDYYPYPKISIIDKKYLPIIFKNNDPLLPNTYIGKEKFDDFVNRSKNNLFFLKPASKFIGGSNEILISTDPYELYNRFIVNDYVIQEEVKPKLIDGYKFDLRIYVLIVYNKDVMHIYIDYGIVRFCKKEYIVGNTSIDNNITIHGEFKYTNDIKELSIYYNLINDIIYKTLYLYDIPSDNVDFLNMGIYGYQYLGYDIIISDDEKLYLLEINIQPSLERIKYDTYLIKDFSSMVIKSILDTNRGYRPFISKYKTITLSDLSIKYHLSDLYEITKDYDTMKYIGNLQVWSYEKTKRFINYGNSDGYYYKAIIYDNKIIGVIGVYKKNNIDEYYYLVIYLSKKNSGKGFGKYALELFLLTIDYSPIYADVLDSNINSIKFFKNIGYTHTIVDNGNYRFIIRQ